MKIKRTIDGKEYEFELTEQELNKAYEERDIYFCKENIIESVGDMLDARLIRRYGAPWSEIKKHIDDIAAAYKDYLETYLDDHYWDAIDYAIETGLNMSDYHK